MGLTGRKVKQRIAEDPRNLSWVDDASRFGSNYLAKFGWDSSKGLGVSGDGRTSHIKVSHKLDMLGIGAAHQNDPNGIAWKQNLDFEKVLARLNNGMHVEGYDEDEVLSGFHRPTESLAVSLATEGDDEKVKTRKKRKHSNYADATADAKRLKKEKTKAKKRVIEEAKTTQLELVDTSKDDSIPMPPKQHVPRHRAHRARAIAAKSISTKSAAQISEILGIAPSSSSTPLAESPTPQGHPPPTDDLTAEKIQTSKRSVAEYFRDRLQVRSAGITLSREVDASVHEDAHDSPRCGLGSSRLRVEVMELTGKDSSNSTGAALSSSSSFLLATSSMAMRRTAGSSLTSAIDSRQPVSCQSVETSTERKPKESCKIDREASDSPETKNPETERLDKRKRKKREGKDENRSVQGDKDYTTMEKARRKHDRALRKSSKSAR